MPTVQVEAQLSSDTLLQAAEQLSLSELEELEARLRALSARRKAPSLSHEESVLLLTINQGLSSSERGRLDELVDKRREEMITPAEYRELLDLTDKSENLNAQRVAALADLARLRGVSLPEVMDQLGLRASEIM